VTWVPECHSALFIFCNWHYKVLGLLRILLFSKITIHQKYYRSKLSTVHHITSHIGETDAGLDRPLYLRNKLYDKTLKYKITTLICCGFRCHGDLPYGNTIPLDFQDGGPCHLGFSKIGLRNFNSQSAVGGQCASPCQFSSKSVIRLQRYT